MFRLIIASLAILSLGSPASAGIFGHRHRACQPVAAQVPVAAPQPVSYWPSAPAGHSSALDEVNVLRARRGLPAYVSEPNLEVAALAAAMFRAERGMFGHAANDFVFLPAGSHADATGCAANEARYGFMACEVLGNYRYAGAAMIPVNGKLYCHLFLRR